MLINDLMIHIGKVHDKVPTVIVQMPACTKNKDKSVEKVLPKEEEKI